ncbi:MAG: 30S ribosomal protein S6 [Candidatus Pacebacteria bacterium]|nr:30S ribosomal protein S6 [Candidatus Paceibacterota bacterium]
MAENNMPAAEAPELFDDERKSYEFAFHVLPTVAEGEVAGVFEALKALITQQGGEIFSEEAPERIDLAYAIVQSVQGKHRKYASAYFGWIRFTLNGERMEALAEEIDANQSLLRHLIIKLTKAEEENPYRFHENRKSKKVVDVVDTPVADSKETKDAVEEPATKEATASEASTPDAAKEASKEAAADTDAEKKEV